MLGNSVVHGVAHHLTQRGNRQRRVFFKIDDDAYYSAERARLADWPWPSGQVNPTGKAARLGAADGWMAHAGDGAAHLGAGEIDRPPPPRQTARRIVTSGRAVHRLTL